MDDSFISAILSSPADLSIRRDYAEALRDSDAARAGYLEMEWTWAASRQPADLRELQNLARQIDPVWVARISRPPVGVCCDRLRNYCDTESAPPRLSPAEIGWVESRFQLTLPADYRAFLLNYNGALSPTCRLEISAEQREMGCNEYVFFCSILEAREAEIDDTADLVWMLQLLEDDVRQTDKRLEDLPYEWQREMAQHWRGEPYASWMVIGTGAPTGEMEWYCLECRGPDTGRVFCADVEALRQPDHCLLASSFAEFLGLICEQAGG